MIKVTLSGNYEDLHDDMFEHLAYYSTDARNLHGETQAIYKPTVCQKSNLPVN